jgi:hypothetical protein
MQFNPARDQTRIEARRRLTPWLLASVGVIVFGFVLNPVILLLVLPEATFVAFMTWTYTLWPYGWDLAAIVLLPLQVIGWIVVCGMAVGRVGKRGYWLLLGAPFVLIPAFAANYLILGCYLLGQCP